MNSTKKALLIGCGSKWGETFTKTIANSNYTIDLVTHSDFSYPNVNTVKIDWHSISLNQINEIIPLTDYNLIFFNHNSAGAVNDHWLKDGHTIPQELWNKSYWIDCQFPYYVIKHLNGNIREDTKIGWMLTGLIVNRNSEHFKFAGYAASKSVNFHLMRGFSQVSNNGIYFAINPGRLIENDHKKDSEDILQVIEKITKLDSGKSFSKDGSVWM